MGLGVGSGVSAEFRVRVRPVGLAFRPGPKARVSGVRCAVSSGCKRSRSGCGLEIKDSMFGTAVKLLFMLFHNGSVVALGSWREAGNWREAEQRQRRGGPCEEWIREQEQRLMGFVGIRHWAAPPADALPLFLPSSLRIKRD